jgi:hypothetical protein
MATYTLISSNVLSSSAASVTFSAIPSTYTDLVVRVSARSDRAAVNGYILYQVNSLTSGYSDTYVYGTGSSALSSRNGSTTLSFAGYITGDNTNSGIFGSTEIYIPSYTVSQNKPMSSFSLAENAAVAANIGAHALLLSNTATVSSLTFSSLGDNFVTGSSFYLYGISNA